MMTKREAERVAKKVRKMNCIAAFRRWRKGGYEAEARDFVIGSMDELQERLGPTKA